MFKDLRNWVRDRPHLRSGALRARALGRTVARATPGVYTLCYHHVATTARDGLASQIRFLKRFGPFLDIDAGVERLRSGRARHDVSFVLTFDDGYADNVDVALPVLKALDVPATLFMVSDWIDAPPGRFDRTKGYMTRADVATWRAAGLDIGSHGATHARLSHLGPDQVRAEMIRSRDALSAMTETSVRHFACPWGVSGHDYDAARDPALAAACGYETFFTTRRGAARDADDLPAMPRHVLEPEWGLHQLTALLGGSRFGAR